MKKITCHFLLISTVLISSHLMVGCGSSARITGSWKSPDAVRKAYTKVLVAALTSDAYARQTVETDLVSRLQRKGIQATRSIDIFPPTFREGKLPAREDIIKTIRETGHDAVLTASLIKSNTETRYVPGTLTYAPVGPYYSNFYGYYSRVYPMVYSSDYYTTLDTYFLETNLYEVGSEKLLWSAQSKTYDPPSIRDFSRDLAQLTVDRLAKDGIL
ncbi:hypothetical protein [Spirosoma montaniterrae]|uniref:DUF4136 domain-containing protein n=1 Tax=Spirosoma montaniterrae TaxID=1178516 RepID=A0A1P9X2X6_9BACT|nr:hypothetical protein [Spirosoma montaniterrae]AQG81984.1 hypothetical protein AWR27_23410 [Spirosoma montaniterrae]